MFGDQLASIIMLIKHSNQWRIKTKTQIDFVTNLINDAGVAAVPGRGFFHRNCDGESYHHQYVRFAFCKSDDTLTAFGRLELEWCERKTLLPGWWLEAGAGVV